MWPGKLARMRGRERIKPLVIGRSQTNGLVRRLARLIAQGVVLPIHHDTPVTVQAA